MTTEVNSRRHQIKTAMTEAVLAELPTKQRPSLEDALKIWWLNIRQQGGFRLSDHGDAAFQLAEIEYNNYEYSTTNIDRNKNVKPAWTKIVLDIDQILNVPYYFYRGDKKQIMIRVYDSKTSMLVSLYGSFEEYIESVKSRKKR